jgi:hypothetical protein
MTKKTLYVILVALSAGILMAADAFTGTWKLVPEASLVAKGKAAKGVTAVVTEQGQNLNVAVQGVDPDGKQISVKWSEPMKGGTRTYTQGAPPAGTTITSKRVDANTIDSTTTVNGKQTSTGRAQVSKDGKTITVTTKGTDDKGKAFESKEVYARQ